MISVGLGNIGFNIPDVIPAATVTGARSGTSLSGTFVELGGGLSPLLHNTVINSGTFNLTMRDSSNVIFLEWTEATQEAVLGDRSRRANVAVDMATNAVGMGDTFNAANGTILGVVDGNRIVEAYAMTGRMLTLDRGNDIYGMGDIDFAVNGTSLSIDDTNSTFTAIGQGSAMLSLVQSSHTYKMGDLGFSNNASILSIQDNTPALLFGIGAFTFLNLNQSSQQYNLGDLSGHGNQTCLIISDNAQQAQFSSGGFSMIFADMQNGIFQLGSGGGGTPNLSYFEVNDTTQRFTTHSSGLTNGLFIDLGALNFVIGDDAGAGSSTEIQINDGAQLFAFNSNGGRFLTLDAANRTFSMGDLLGVGNSSFIDIQDVNQNFTFNSGGNIYLRIDPGNGEYRVGRDTQSNVFIDHTNTLVTVTADSGLKIVQSGGVDMLTIIGGLTNFAGASVGTLTNAPAAGNPTKWISINDGGTVRKIPTWQ